MSAHAEESNLPMKEMLKPTGYIAPASLADKTFAQATSGGGGSSKVTITKTVNWQKFDDTNTWMCETSLSDSNWEECLLADKITIKNGSETFEFTEKERNNGAIYYPSLASFMAGEPSVTEYRNNGANVLLLSLYAYDASNVPSSGVTFEYTKPETPANPTWYFYWNDDENAYEVVLQETPFKIQKKMGTDTIYRMIDKPNIAIWDKTTKTRLCFDEYGSDLFVAEDKVVAGHEYVYTMFDINSGDTFDSAWSKACYKATIENPKD